MQQRLAQQQRGNAKSYRLSRQRRERSKRLNATLVAADTTEAPSMARETNAARITGAP
jgi:hypothetical protein